MQVPRRQVASETALTQVWNLVPQWMSFKLHLVAMSVLSGCAMAGPILLPFGALSWPFLCFLSELFWQGRFLGASDGKGRDEFC